MADLLFQTRHLIDDAHQRYDRGPPGITATTRMDPSGDAIPKLFALAPGWVLWWFPGSGSRR